MDLDTQNTALNSLTSLGITLAADGAEYQKISQYSPVDATTNPSLVYAAVSSAEYSHHLQEAIIYASNKSETSGQKAELAMDYVLLTFASEILSRIPGRVSVSIDPRLFLPFTASPLDGDIFRRVLARCLKLHNLAFHVLPNLFSSRLLFKIPATPLGIAIANELQRKHSIHTNLTLVFSPIQALACAQAGVSVISPFVGRVKDYYESRGFTMPIKADGTIDMSKHPGVHLVKEIRQMFIAEGYDRQTEIMACGFRSVDEITELCSLGREGGPDLITVQPELLDGLRSRPPLAVAQELGSTKQLKNKPVYFTPLGATDISLALLEGQLAEECIAPIKVSEGLQKFSADANRLEDAIRKSLEKEGSKKLETVLISSGSTLYSYYKAAIIKFLEGWRALSLY